MALAGLSELIRLNALSIEERVTASEENAVSKGNRVHDEDGRTKRLSELIRLHERNIDKQLELLASEQARTEKSIDLGATLVAIAPTAWTLVAASHPAAFTPIVLGIAGLAGLITLTGVAWLIWSSFVASRRRAIGPSSAWLTEQNGESEPLEAIQENIIDGFPEYAKVNSNELKKSRRSRRLGVSLLVVGLALFGGTFAFVIRGLA